MEHYPLNLRVNTIFGHWPLTTTTTTTHTHTHTHTLYYQRLLNYYIADITIINKNRISVISLSKTKKLIELSEVTRSDQIKRENFSMDNRRISLTHLYTVVVCPLPLALDVVMILNWLTVNQSRSHAIHDVITRLCQKQFVDVIFLSLGQQRISDPFSQDIKVIGDNHIRMSI